MKYSIEKNVLVKKPLPNCGVVCSNPARSERLTTNLQNVIKHTDTWGVCIYTGTYHDKSVFVASVPMGAAGSGFAFLEMFAAGVEYLIRYGSNDRYVTEDNLRDILLINEADNLSGIMHDGGYNDKEHKLLPSDALFKALSKEIKTKGFVANEMICHNVEDYHAFNFPDLFENSEVIKNKINLLEADNQKRHCWDMETAALFFRAKQFNAHAATILQCLIKHNIKNQPYETEYANIFKEMEQHIFGIIFDTLSLYVNDKVPTSEVV